MDVERRYNTILFDFDGTIYDSGEGIIRCVREAIEKFHLPEQPLSVLHRFIGPPLKYMFETVFNLTPDEAQVIVDFYRKNYRESKGYLQGYVYEGIVPMLKTLNEKGCTCAVASAKKEYTVADTLKYYDLYKYFKVVRGAEQNNEYADKAEIITECLNMLRVSRNDYESVLMIGDTVFDGEAANGLNIDFAMALWGYGFVTEEEIESVSYVIKADSPNQMLKFILHSNA